METVYRAFDGKIFSNADVCRKHEQEVGYIMYDEEGNTHYASTAYVVNILTDKGVENFIKLCEEAGASSEGICQKGLWMWDFSVFSYILITDEILKVLNLAKEQKV